MRKQNERFARKKLIADYNTYGYKVIILPNVPKELTINNKSWNWNKKTSESKRNCSILLALPFWGQCDRRNKIIYLNSKLFTSSMPISRLYLTFFHEIAHNKYDNETICDIIAKVRLIFKKW